MFYRASAGVVKFLLEHGADVNAKNNYGRTPLFDRATYAESNNAEVLKILLEHGADVNAKNNYGQTPLHNVSTVEKVKILLEHGADVNAKDNYGQTPLLHYTAPWKTEIVKVLLEHGAIASAEEGNEPSLEIPSSMGTDSNSNESSDNALYIGIENENNLI